MPFLEQMVGCWSFASVAVPLESLIVSSVFFFLQALAKPQPWAC